MKTNFKASVICGRLCVHNVKDNYTQYIYMFTQLETNLIKKALGVK